MGHTIKVFKTNKNSKSSPFKFSWSRKINACVTDKLTLNDNAFDLHHLLGVAMKTKCALHYRQYVFLTPAVLSAPEHCADQWKLWHVQHSKCVAPVNSHTAFEAFPRSAARGKLGQPPPMFCTRSQMSAWLPHRLSVGTSCNKHENMMRVNRKMTSRTNQYNQH